MRLAIVNLTGGGFSGGYRKYLKNMLPRLAEHNDVEALLCVSPQGIDVSSWFEKLPKVEYATCSPLTFRHLAHIPDSKMAECLRKFSPDVVFLSVDRYIRFKDIPVVNMIQNMESFMPKMKGDTPREMFKKFIQRKLACNSVKLADHTIAVSGFVKDYITATLHVPESKVSQIYYGLTPALTGSCIRPVSVPIGWKGAFLFACGSIRPARGLEDVLGAFYELRALNLDMRLVIAGEAVSGMRAYRDGLKRLLALRGLTDSVSWTGNLSEAEMGWCYKNCTVFIMTSRVESFGQIALEAMSYGCLCVSANNPCLPEIFGDAAVYYNPGDEKALSELINNLLSWDEFKMRQTTQRALERASQFSWDVTADRTMAVLMQVLKRSKCPDYSPL
jgi:glycosyltransferase involved in cell wall biosynthesis